MLSATQGNLLMRVRRLLAPPSSANRQSFSLFSVLLTLGVVAIPIAVAAQIKPASTPTTQQIAAGNIHPATEPTYSEILPQDLKPLETEYKFVPKDLLQIELDEVAGPGVKTQRVLRVSADGKISLPLLKDTLPVAGHSIEETQQLIVKAYQAAAIGKNMTCIVTAIERRGWLFSAMGHFSRPGEYAIP